MVPEWEETFGRIRVSLASSGRAERGSWPSQREISYVFDAPRTLAGGQAVVGLYHSDVGRRGTRLAPRSRELRLADLRRVPDLRDRSILAALRGTLYSEDYLFTADGYQRVGLSSTTIFSTYHLDTDLVRLLLPRMCTTGRLYLQTSGMGPFEQTPGAVGRGGAVGVSPGAGADCRLERLRAPGASAPRGGAGSPWPGRSS